MKFFMSLLISGLVLGGTYGLIALGYSLIYKASGLMSFVQGDIMTLGAYLGLTFFSILKLPFVVSVLLTVICAFLVGPVAEFCMPVSASVVRKCLARFAGKGGAA